MWAMWGDDVLVVRRGPVCARIIPLRAQLTGGVGARSSHDVRRCGPNPVSVVLRIWDGSYVEVAAADADRLSLVGPYVAAALDNVPTAPIPAPDMTGLMIEMSQTKGGIRHVRHPGEIDLHPR
jgi:hypothetical protein